jgi:hypothetical protein
MHDCLAEIAWNLIAHTAQDAFIFKKASNQDLASAAEVLAP